MLEEAVQAANAEVSVPAAPPDPAVANELGEETEGKTAEEQAASEETQDEHKPKGGFQRRIDRLTKEKADKERELEYWREQALRTQRPEPQQQAQPADRPKPVADSYGNYEDFVEALADWKAEQSLKKYRAEETTRQEMQKRQSEQQRAAQTWAEKVDKARDEHPDFDDAFARIPANPALADALMGSDFGAEIVYFLGNNPAEAKRIASMPLTSNRDALAIAREVGKIEARLAKGSNPAESPPLSKAPLPATPTRKSGPAGTPTPDSPDSDRISDEEWMRARWAQKRG